MEPLASKFRPQNLNEFIGQEHLVGEGKPIRKFIETGNIPSMIFWGPPGTGKTTLAYIISKTVHADFYKLSAVMSGKAQLMDIIKKAMKQSQSPTLTGGDKTILFLDEIHRWNKSQQDALLPYVEKGVIILIGATTENPSFSLIPALLSRCRVFTFQKHETTDVEKYVNLLVEKLNNTPDFVIPSLSKRGKGGVDIDKESIEFIAKASDGDLRTSANILESTLFAGEGEINKEILKKTVENFLQYESRGEDHYNIISAVHKSLRDSDPDAGVYWVTRMLEAGDDPLYIARRLLRFASEDIGNADPQAVILANTIFETCQKLGRPECDVALIQLAIYLARAPKSNEAYFASNLAKQDVQEYGSLPVPLHIRNAPTKLMKELNYGKGYKYAHDYKDAKVDQEHLPDQLKNKKYTK
ncbi:MAG: replication-associated recombination protein A [Candidatus Dojkabacteria bacterium]